MRKSQEGRSLKEKLVINLESLLLHGNEDFREQIFKREEKRRKSPNKAHMARKGNPILGVIFIGFLVLFLPAIFYGLCLGLEPLLDKLQSILLVRSLRFLFMRLLGWGWVGPLILLLGLVSGLGSSLHMMDPAGWEGESSSHAPQSEPNVNRPTEPAEPVAPDPDAFHPILDDNTRRAELDERAGFHLVGLSEKTATEIMDSQVHIEKAIEKALLSDGYSREELNKLSKRNEIRGFLFYPKGKLLSAKTYKKHSKEVSFGTHRSTPYRHLIDAISSSRMFLKKVTPIKKWESKRLF